MTPTEPPPARTTLTEALAALPPEWPEDVLPALSAAVRAAGQKVVALDDDPTGTQTVHGVPVLTTWGVPALRDEFAGGAGAFYILTNSRSLTPAEAAALNTEAGRNLRAAADSAGSRFVVVSRSDSTLRGHFPGEVDALAAALGGGFDALLLAPAFFPGGRYTLNDIHYVAEGDRLTPAGEAEFARDRTFGYRASNLRDWVAEKTGGRIAREAVASVSLELARRGGPEAVRDYLLHLPRGAVCVLNAASERDLAVCALAAVQAEGQGRRFLYRTAASFVQLRAALPTRPLLEAAELRLPTTGGGLIVAGSYVAKSTAQLNALLTTGRVQGVEVDVQALLGAGAAAEIARATQGVEAALRAGDDALLFTSRRLVAGNDAAASLEIGRRVSAGLVSVVRGLAARPRYVVAKGGITSSDIATEALGVRRALVLGQILPGIPVWQTAEESRWPGLAYVVFPGNVGGPEALAEIVRQFRQGANAH